jgi:hypothetical protein
LGEIRPGLSGISRFEDQESCADVSAAPDRIEIAAGIAGDGDSALNRTPVAMVTSLPQVKGLWRFPSRRGGLGYGCSTSAISSDAMIPSDAGRQTTITRRRQEGMALADRNLIRMLRIIPPTKRFEVS